MGSEWELIIVTASIYYVLGTVMDILSPLSLSACLPWELEVADGTFNPVLTLIHGTSDSDF